MKRVLIAICFFMFMTSFASSEIIFSQGPNGLYNLGDSLHANFSIYDSGIADYVEAYVVCDGEKFIIKKEYILIPLGENEKVFSIDFPAPITGDCRLFANFNGESANSTSEFKISDEILIDFYVNNSFFPEENIFVSGFAKKENGDFFNGVVVLTIDEQSSKVYSTDGNFSFDFPLSSEISSGDYNLIISASDGFLNFGEGRKTVRIKAKPTEVLISSDTDSILPPNNFYFNVSLLDQSGNLIPNESVLVKIFNSSNDFFEKSIFSGEEMNYSFKGDSVFGVWRIDAWSKGVSSSLYIYVEENEDAVVRVDEKNNAIVKNAGNVEYNGVVSFNLTCGEGVEEIYKNISHLGVGKTQFLILDNPHGNCTLNFGNETFKNIHFETSNSISALSIFSVSELTPRSYVIGFLILILFALGFIYRKKLLRGLKYGFGKKEKGDAKVFHEKFVKKEIKEKKKKERKVVSKSLNACMVFLKFDKFIGMDDLFEAYGFNFKPVSDNLGYVLFYSAPDKDPEKKMFDFARQARSFANENGRKVSIVINSMPFRGMEEVKSFAGFNRKLLNFSEGQIFVPSRILEKIHVGSLRKMKTFSVDGEDVDVCIL